MSTLREKIAIKISESNGDANVASIEICKLLDYEVGLSGNGWFDNDPVMLEALGIES